MEWIGAFSIGVSLGLLGSGGSILTVPVLIFLVGVTEKVAIAESLAIVGLIALSGAVPRALARNVDCRTVLLFGLPGVFGSYLGAAAASFVSAVVQLLLFAAVMLVAAVLMYRTPNLTTAEAGETVKRPVLKIAIDGLVVGAVTGLVGVGGGFLIVPALVLLGGLSIHLSIGTSLAIIALKSATGFWKYTHVLADLDLSVDWQRIVLFAFIGFAGTLLGGRLADRLPKHHLQRLFAGFLVIMGAFTLWQYAPRAF